MGTEENEAERVRQEQYLRRHGYAPKTNLSEIPKVPLEMAWDIISYFYVVFDLIRVGLTHQDSVVLLRCENLQKKHLITF